MLTCLRNANMQFRAENLVHCGWERDLVPTPPMWTEFVVSISSMVKRLLVVGFFFFPKREIIPSYTLLKTESHKTEKGGAKAEALSLLEEDPSNVVWSSSEKHCCICLLLSVVLSGQLSAGGSFSFSWSYPTVIKKISYTAYLLNSQFALEDSQAEPECIWGAE